MLIVLPVAALASCGLHLTDGNPATDCQMMSKHFGSASIQNAVPVGACCDLSSGKPVPAAMVQAPRGTLDGVAPAPGVSSVDVPSITAIARPITPPLRAFAADLQAILSRFSDLSFLPHRNSPMRQACDGQSVNNKSQKDCPPNSLRHKDTNFNRSQAPLEEL